MTADGHRREDWADYFERLGIKTIRCAGPQATTCALTLQQRCPLHEAADCIFYDEEATTPELLAQLRANPPSVPIAYARSQRDAEGRERAVPTHVVSPTRR